MEKRKSFINIILSYDHAFRYCCSQVVTENGQTEALSSFVTAVEKCGANNKTNPVVSLLAGLFFMLLLSPAAFSKLTFNKRLSGTQSKIDADQ